MILLEEIDTAFGQIRVVRSKATGTCTYVQEGCFHSQVDEAGVSTCSYIHVSFSIVRQARARQVLVVGCAGGTLATMLHRASFDVTVVDVNPHAFALARKYFQMPNGVRCVVADGSAHLRAVRDRYGAIVIDAFDRDGTVPEQFTSQGFFTMARAAMAQPGIIALNIMVEHDLDPLADRVARNIEAAGLDAILFDRAGLPDRNVLVVGGAVDGLRIRACNKPRAFMAELDGMVRRKAGPDAAALL